MSNPVFALIDCNNFFVSCERLFRPDLEGKPIVVLSSNDGCAVARSNEAKLLGIPMGAPAYKYRDTFRAHQVVQFSANFELYGDISERITRLLTSITPHTEVYSVDESFLDLSQLDITDYQAWGESLRARIMREVGLPVSIGIAPSKTLAKLGAEHAKHESNGTGVIDLFSLAPEDRDAYLLRTPVQQVWGIGWRLSPKLKGEAIFTALDLARMRSHLAQQMMGIKGRQLVAELNGTSVSPIEPLGKIRKSVMHGRLFGADTSQFSVVEAAIASLTARAAHRLRSEGLVAHSAVVSLSTNRHKPGYQRISQVATFRVPTAETGAITSQLISSLAATFSGSTLYHRADVLLYDLVSAQSLQADLFGDFDLTANQAAVARMAALDSVNRRYGKGTLHMAAEDLSQAWQPKHQLRSPRYTSNWQELPIAYLS